MMLLSLDAAWPREASHYCKFSQGQKQTRSFGASVKHILSTRTPKRDSQPTR